MELQDEPMKVEDMESDQVSPELQLSTPIQWPAFYKYNPLHVECSNEDDWKFYGDEHDFPSHWDTMGWGWHPLWQAMRDKEDLGLDSLALGNFAAAVQYLRQAYELAKKRLDMQHSDFWTCGTHKYPVSDCFNLCIELSQAFRCQKRFKTARLCLREAEKYSQDDGLLWLKELEQARLLLAECWAKWNVQDLEVAKMICENAIHRFNKGPSSFKGVEIRDEFILLLIEIHSNLPKNQTLSSTIYDQLSLQGLASLSQQHQQPLDHQWLPNLPFRRAFSTTEVSDIYFDLAKTNFTDRLLDTLDTGLDPSDTSPIAHQIYWTNASLLHYAIKHSPTLELEHVISSVLRSHGHMANLEDEDGETPLHWALRAGRLQAARVLLEHGADVTTATRIDMGKAETQRRKDWGSHEEKFAAVAGSTSLHLLCWAEDRHRDLDTSELEWIARLMVRNGADMEAKDRKGMTPYMVAARTSRMKGILEGLGAGIAAA